MKFFEQFLRRLAGMVLVVALLALPMTATAAPVGEPDSPWAGAWHYVTEQIRALLSEVGSGYGGGDAVDRSQPTPGSVRGASGLGSTLDPDGTKAAPGDREGLSDLSTDIGLGSTLDPDG